MCCVVIKGLKLFSNYWNILFKDNTRSTPVCLPLTTSDFDVENRETVTAIGMGDTDIFGNWSPNLSHVDISVRET